MSRILISAVFLLSGVVSLWGADVAVLEFKSKGILDQAVLRELHERLVSAAVEQSGIEVLDASTTRTRLFEANVLVPANCDSECIKRLGEKVGAEHLIFPNVLKDQDRLQISLQLVRVSDARMVAETSTWVDGRVGPFLHWSVQEVFAGFRPNSGGKGIPGHVKTAVVSGVLAVGAVLAVVLSDSEIVVKERQRSINDLPMTLGP